MHLQIELENRKLTVAMTDSSCRGLATIDGKEIAYDCVRLPDGRYSIILGGRVFDFIVDLPAGSGTVTDRQGSHALTVSDSRHRLPRREIEEGQSGLQQLTADMPGKVVRILVREGETVACDQGLLVLEAMKMQNEIRAPKSGVVKKIGATEGKAVNTGEFLLSLE